MITSAWVIYKGLIWILKPDIKVFKVPNNTNFKQAFTYPKDVCTEFWHFVHVHAIKISSKYIIWLYDYNIWLFAHMCTCIYHFILFINANFIMLNYNVIFITSTIIFGRYSYLSRLSHFLNSVYFFYRSGHLRKIVKENVPSSRIWTYMPLKFFPSTQLWRLNKYCLK